MDIEPTDDSSDFLRRLLAGPRGAWLAALDPLWWRALAEPPSGWWEITVFYWNRVAQIAAPLWLGLVLFGLLAAVASYCVVFYSLRNWQERTNRKLRLQNKIG